VKDLQKTKQPNAPLSDWDFEVGILGLLGWQSSTTQLTTQLGLNFRLKI
jgi:hypothetical protein